jgi:hypothetical protein
LASQLLLTLFLKKQAIMKNEKMLLVGAATVAIAAAAILYMRKKEEISYDNPPKRAPQLDLENPGTQDNFPKPPMESDMG